MSSEIRDAFDEGFGVSKLGGPIEQAWERSEARQADHAVGERGESRPGTPSAHDPSSSQSLSGAARALVEQLHTFSAKVESYRIRDIDRYALKRWSEEVETIASSLSALLAQAGAPTAHLEKELEAAKADAIHGWSEVDHQKAHKEEYMRMLEVAEAEIARLRGEAGAPHDDKDARAAWMEQHLNLGHTITKHEQYDACTCGATHWRDGKSSARPREESQS